MLATFSWDRDEEGYLKGTVTPYDTNPEKPMGSWKTAWNQARKVAGVILAGNPEETDDNSSDRLPFP
jgi:hypothetical protein